MVELPPRPMKISRRWAWTAIILLSLAAHLRGIASPPMDYHYDRQSIVSSVARNYHRNGLHFMTPQVDWLGHYKGKAATEFPLYIWLVGLLWPLAGLGALWGRILSLFFSAATAVYLFEFLSAEVEIEAALAAALVFSVLPLEMYFGRAIQGDAMALFATMAAIYHWNLALAPGRPRAHWAAAVFFAFVAASVKLPYTHLLIPLAAMAFLRLGRPALKDGRVWLAPALCLGGVLAWYWYSSTGVYFVPHHISEFTSMLDYDQLPYFIQFQFLSRFPELCATYAGVLFGAVGAHELIVKRGKSLFAWWFAAVSLYVVICGGYTFHHEYSSLPFTLINAVFIGLGVAQLAARAKALAAPRRGWALAAVALAVLSMPVHAAFRINHWYRLSYPFLKNAGAVAARVSRPDDLFICNQRAWVLFLYFMDRRGWSWELAEAGADQLGRVEDAIGKGARFFLTEKSGPFAAQNQDNVYARYFYSRYPVIYDDGAMTIFKLAPAAKILPTKLRSG